ncbi:hypothetical protein M2651_08790 [Clostridium sp. SYSU_GA19001]|uniref:hypothetical protein n=1 Tax=Clostridium caldaquaticum TaxID=2940653 RepID=UPI0020775A87|nr:hypothetical protein [Clostridium caldaquaticum]MCM8711123.1 hypothetical protein [Clostridium caldaquaticum]
MQKSIYKFGKIYINSVLGWITVIYLVIILLFCLIWFLPGSDKGNYKAYKVYESKIDKRFEEIKNNVDSSINKYYSNEISKKKLIINLYKYANELEKLYDSFNWKKGDEVTKELFIIKKQIIIEYIQLYKDKATALEKGIMSNEIKQTEYINLLVKQYNLKDIFQKERYNLSF